MNSYGAATCSAGGRRVFPALTIDENLQMAATPEPKRKPRTARKKCLRCFPRLFERRDQIAAYVPARATNAGDRPARWMTDPGAAGARRTRSDWRLYHRRIYEVIAKLRNEMKMTVLLVEAERATRASIIADYAYILETGRVGARTARR